MHNFFYPGQSGRELVKITGARQINEMTTAFVPYSCTALGMLLVKITGAGYWEATGQEQQKKRRKKTKKKEETTPFI